MRHVVKPHFLFVSLSLMMSSCAIEFEVESQRTVLEQQILGAYEELDDDLVLITSVRAVNQDGSTKSVKLTPLEKRAVAARQNQQFNQDDIKELRDKQLIGENREGDVTILPKSIGKIAKAAGKDRKFAEVIVTEENADRQVIWQRIIEKSPDLSQKDLPLVRQNYHEQIIEKLAKGHWFQGKDGKWIQKT